jgi:D-serine deaminase-like pyridoxal phosphate-dependent protein
MPPRLHLAPDISPAPERFESLETPVPLVDLDRLAANLDRMASYTVLHGLALRPHVKTHKSPRIAAEQLRLGASGLTCATIRELEVMADVSDDLLLAYPPVGMAKLARLGALPESVQLTVAVDSMLALEGVAAAARAADRPIRILVEADLGMHRVGVQTADDAVALAIRVSELPPLVYGGLLFYPGHIRQDVASQDAPLARLRDDLASLHARLAAAGFPPPVVSGGSTPLAWRMHEIPQATEVRPGTYVYNDRTTSEIGACTWDDCALTVLATVVSTAVAGQAVIDAGSKALGREPLRGTDGEGFGALLDRQEVVVSRMSEEHGILDLSRTSWRPRVGDLLRVVPNHVCIVVHLHETIFGVRGERVETRWPVSARGRAGVGAGAA